jgi:hypothetical protein
VLLLVAQSLFPRKNAIAAVVLSQSIFGMSIFFHKKSTDIYDIKFSIIGFMCNIFFFLENMCNIF